MPVICDGRSMVTGSFLGLSYERTIRYCARSRRTEDFMSFSYDSVMGIIWSYSHAVLRSSNRNSDVIIICSLKDILRT